MVMVLNYFIYLIFFIRQNSQGFSFAFEAAQMVTLLYMWAGYAQVGGLTLTHSLSEPPANDSDSSKFMWIK